MRSHLTKHPRSREYYAKLPAGTEIAVGVPPLTIGTQTGSAGREVTVKNGKITTYNFTSSGGAPKDPENDISVVSADYAT